jgi:arylformamidase
MTPKGSPEGWIDISVPLKQDMVHFPNDPIPPKIYRMHDVEKGDKVTMSVLNIISHTGTHVDTPLHFIPGGSTVSDIPLDALIGPTRVIEIKDRDKIKVEELEPYDIKAGERILFKTRNSPVAYESEKFVEDYVYISSEAARYLAEKKVRLVGLDCITIGHFKEPDNLNQTHIVLLKAGVYILEDCALAGVAPGDYELICLPLLIDKGDAGPCRAILRPLQ